MSWMLVAIAVASAPADTAASCDYDGDGYEAPGCGGDDCDDSDAGVNPGAEEVPADGQDQDCDGLDGAEPVLWVESGGCLSRSGLGLGLAGGLLLRRRR